MILFPAIDLKDGQCVRLKLGDMEQATVFNDSPAAQAKAFEDQGFEWLHVVDLDGAFAGESRNGAAVDAILAATRNPVRASRELDLRPSRDADRQLRASRTAEPPRAIRCVPELGPEGLLTALEKLFLSEK